jgi:hypothetical protein
VATVRVALYIYNPHPAGEVKPAAEAVATGG